MDREKVIERLEYCAETRDGYVRDCINDALELLKEQSPNTPKKGIHDGDSGKCPICGYRAEHHYCPNCGQALYWDI